MDALSAVAAPSTASNEALRLVSVDDRVRELKKRIRDNKPSFVVMYGLGDSPTTGIPYLSYWSQIAGTPLTVSSPTLIDGTVFAATPHPTAHGVPTSYWTELGKSILDLHDGK